MAKAVRQSTAETWVTLQAVHPLVLEICGSPSLAGPWLAEQIAAKRVRVKHQAVRPASTSAAEIESFWQGSPPTIDFKDCSAMKLVVSPPGIMATGICEVTLLGVKVVREDIEALKPGAAPQLPVAPSLMQKPRDWLRIAKRTHPRRKGETQSAFPNFGGRLTCSRLR